MFEVDPIFRTTGLDRNLCVFLSRKRPCFWDSTKEGVYAKERAIVKCYLQVEGSLRCYQVA